MGEWFGALGLAWPRLLLYPGGLSALFLAWLLDRVVVPQAPRRATAGHHPPDIVALSAVVAPLLLISLLPLPYTRPFDYTPDLPTALVLLEWPLLLQMGTTRQAAAPAQYRALLAGYTLLLLATLVLAQISGSLRLDVLTRTFEQPALTTALERLAVSAGWSIALLPLLRFSLADTAAADGLLTWGLRLRALGHLLLAGISWLPVIPTPAWLAPLLLGGIALLLAATLRWSTRPAANHWQIIFTATATGLVLILGWEAYGSLAARLR